MPIKDKKANERVRDRRRDRETTDSQSSLNGQTNRHTYTHTTLAGTYRSNRFHPSGLLTAKCERWLKWGGGRGKEWDWHRVWLWCRPRSPTAFCSLLFPPLSLSFCLFLVIGISVFIACVWRAHSKISFTYPVRILGSSLHTPHHTPHPHIKLLHFLYAHFFHIFIRLQPQLMLLFIFQCVSHFSHNF